MNRTTAQQIAKQIAQEPLEILKDAREQAFPNQNLNIKNQNYEDKSENGGQELRDKAIASRRMEAYQRELIDIRREDLFKDLQRRIAQGDEIPLEDYPELSIEQKQVLKAQMEAVAMKDQRSTIKDELQEPAAKKGRRLFNFGKKTEVKRQQTRVENIVPPSG